jgi:ubiquinone/menaquinone biosynthesis C-methylase UbiE
MHQGDGAMRYDSTSIPERYHRSRALTSADVSRWVSLVQAVLPYAVSPVLIDLGCGTGRFTVPLAEQLGVSVIGVDPSQKMLREAARNTSASHVKYREGRAESIPSAANSVALIFISNAIHHVKNLDKALREMHRVLQLQGIVFIRNYALENLASLHYLQFFPEAMHISQDMLWPRRTLVEQFTARGFATLSQGTVHQEASPDFETYLRKIESRVYSDLALIPDEAFDRGLARMKEACPSLGGGPVLEEVDYFVFRRY